MLRILCVSHMAVALATLWPLALAGLAVLLASLWRNNGETRRHCSLVGPVPSSAGGGLCTWRRRLRRIKKKLERIPSTKIRTAHAPSTGPTGAATVLLA